MTRPCRLSAAERPRFASAATLGNIRLMGTSGHAAFDNDDARDFLADLTESPQPADDLRDALATAAVDEGYLEALDGSVAIAAAAIVAVVTDGPIEGVSADQAARMSELGLTHTEAEALAPDALAALDRVVAAGSELAELWAEEGEAAAWRSALEPIREALAAP